MRPDAANEPRCGDRSHKTVKRVRSICGFACVRVARAEAQLSGLADNVGRCLIVGFSSLSHQCGVGIPNAELGPSDIIFAAYSNQARCEAYRPKQLFEGSFSVDHVGSTPSGKTQKTAE
jgi:hypothetical protein